MKRFLIYGFLFCLVVTLFSQKSYADPDNWLDVLNFYRGMSGLPIVFEDKAWSKECAQVAKYMVENDICDHGYNTVALESNLACPRSYETDPEMVEGWISTPLHGQYLISPALHKVGYGSYTGTVKNKNSGNYGKTLTAGVMNVIRGLGTVDSSIKYPIYFPGNGSYMPLSSFGTTELNSAGQDVLKTKCGNDYSASSGSTISLRIGGGTGYSSVTSHSLWQDKTKIDHCLLDGGGGTIAIIPKSSLKAGSDYEVSIKANNTEYKWSFTRKANRMWLGENILWRNSKTGENAIWQMDGYKMKSVELWYESIVASGGCPGNKCVPFYFYGWDPNWEIVGTGDFNNDGYTDIVWRNAIDGQNVIIYMESKSKSRTLHKLPIESDVNWKIVGTGDFNDDDRVDIFWHNTATGQNRIWLMDRSELLSEVGTSWSSDTTWDAVAAGGNFKYERGADLLWRNSVSGSNAVWYMADTKFFGDIDFFLSQPDLAWKIANIGYFDDDDRPDILWRHDLGFYAFWYMEYKDGHLRYKGDDFRWYFWVDPVWKIVGTGRFE